MNDELNVLLKETTINKEKHVQLEEKTEGNKIEEQPCNSDIIKKILITKKQTINEDEDNQDVVIEICRNIQAIIEY